MRLFKLSEDIKKEINKEIDDKKNIKFKIVLKDIFYSYQKGKLKLAEAKTKIINRLNVFLKTDKLTQKIKDDINIIIDKVKSENNPEKIDDIINTLYNIADKNDILIK